MRTFKTNLLGLALAGLILGACSQTATYETADLMNEQASAKNGGFNLSPFGVDGQNLQVQLTGGGNPAINCITDQSGSIYKAEGELSNSWGNGGERTLDVQVWNTLTTIEYRFTLTTTATQTGNIQFFDETTQDWVNITSQANPLVKDVPFAFSRELPAGWKAGDAITEQWRLNGPGGQIGLGNVTYNLIGICTTTSLVADAS